MATVKSVDKMVCPQCGVEMNHHCNKLVYGIGQEIMPPMNVQTEPDLLLGGVIGEFHTCPKCGSSACRST